jgi:hypothetical protein
VKSEKFPLPDHPRRRSIEVCREMKVLVVIAFFLSGLPLVAWPVAAFSSIFLLDPPTRSPLHGFVTAFTIAAIVGYPIIWAISLGCAVMGLKKKASRVFIAATAFFPFALIAATAASAYLWENLGR